MATMRHLRGKARIVCADKRGLSKKNCRRLTKDQVQRCRNMPRENMQILSREFGVSVVAIFAVRHYYTYKDLP